MIAEEHVHGPTLAFVPVGLVEKVRLQKVAVPVPLQDLTQGQGQDVLVGSQPPEAGLPAQRKDVPADRPLRSIP